MRLYCTDCNIEFISPPLKEEICPVCKSPINVIQLNKQSYPKIENIQYKIRKRCDTCKLDRKYLETLEIRENSLAEGHKSLGHTYFISGSLEEKRYGYITNIKKYINWVIDHCPECNGTGYVEEWR